jgi:hypothetical protein
MLLAGTNALLAKVSGKSQVEPAVEGRPRAVGEGRREGRRRSSDLLRVAVVRFSGLVGLRRMAG